ncbi:unnamed protein product [Pedinophyceae sp. YPF-701]|nr:unnamed protein product [Pedinophyceae sp. YPF-701]
MTVLWWKVVAGVAGALLVDAALAWALRRRRNIVGKHVLITGGSSGIGLALAKQFLHEGAAVVSIVARREGQLREAAAELDDIIAGGGPSCAGAAVLTHAADVTSSEAASAAAAALAERAGRPVDVLVACAGSATPGFFHEQDVDVFERTMKLNFLGTVNAIKAVAGGMLERRSGTVVVVSSAMGLMGFTGYSSYAPSKWAVRGLADCLRNEWQRTGVDICVAYPVDTDTPGFAEENKTKPPECHVISSQGSFYSAEATARCIVRGIIAGKYHLPTPDLGVTLLGHLQAGISARALGPLSDAILAAIGAPVLRVIAFLMDLVVRHFQTRRAREQREDGGSGAASEGGGGEQAHEGARPAKASQASLRSRKTGRSSDLIK